MVKKVLALILVIIFCHTAYATHNRAGYIKYKWIGGFTYQVTIITYTRESSISADRDSLPINWGDGDIIKGILDIDTLPRANGGGKGVVLGNDIKYNEYTGIHTYPGFGQYVISMTDPNRIASIINIAKSISVNQAFYIEDTLNILDGQSYLGYNNSPILSKDPIDFAGVHQRFVYNPNAWDPDDDSLTFFFTVPKKALGTNVDEYVDPNKVDGTTGNPIFTINHNTGEVVWDAPEFCGIYNIAILVTEWRRVKGGIKPAVKAGTTVLDMEIIVSCDSDKRPNIVRFNDTCIIAGSLLTKRVTATDPDINQIVTLSARGGAFDAAPPDTAHFTSTSGIKATGFFSWQTICDHISSQPYQVVFTAIDNFPGTPLTDVFSWRIKVVAPPPQDLTASPSGNSIILKWHNPYTCSTIKKFLGFSVWRKEGCTPFLLDTCETGLAGQGFTKIADTLHKYTYTDNKVQRGKYYAYIVLAEFGTLNTFGLEINSVESLASNQACAQLKKDVPVITNVSIRNTNVDTGSVYIAWSKPDPVILDTVQNPGPYKNIVYHSPGFNGSSFNAVDSFKSNTFYQLIDTTYIDTPKNSAVPINTVANPWSYKIKFYSDTNFIGETEVASSIYLSLASATHQLTLSWDEKVPWENSSYTIYRKNKTTGLWDAIDSTSSKTYTDLHLQNDSTYCYYVKSTGSYSASGFIDPIINLSQRVCSIPIDTIGPCPPILTITNNCNNPDFTLGYDANQLIWTKPPVSCAADLLKYRIYYAPSASDVLQIIDSSHFANDTSFVHTLKNSVAGCYAIAGVDSNYNVVITSYVIFIDNCPIYNLPNVFTPNGDEKNDVYHPMLPYKYIDRVDMKIFDSWGVLVFQTTDPAINWDGTKFDTHKVLPQGTYYYVCDVYESHPDGDVKRPKPLQGFIHLYR